MKKAFLISSCCALLAGSGLEFQTVPVSATTPVLLTQTNNTNPTPPKVSTQEELLAPGAAPRQELRFQPKANTKQITTITTNMEAVGTLSGQPMPSMKLPTSVIKMETTITQVDANGDIHSQYLFTDADVTPAPDTPPEMVNALRSAIKQIVGLKGTSIVDNRGQIKSGNIDLPEASDPITNQLFKQISNSLAQSSSPLPQEAIGIGAKWRVASQLNVGGINLSQNTIYELVALKDNVATFNVSLEQQAQSQKLNLPGMPAGATFTIKSLKSQGQGQIVVPLDMVIPVRSNISVRSQNQMSVKPANANEDATFETNISMQMTLESQNPN
ncbi:MAG TPA: hypothetical protein V6C85_02475 [Allocoleopsis sp.]